MTKCSAKYLFGKPTCVRTPQRKGPAQAGLHKIPSVCGSYCFYRARGYSAAASAITLAETLPGTSS